MNRGAKGGRIERRAKKMLEAKGYTVVKSGGSLGLFDLVAWNSTLICFIQVKSGRPPGPLERQRLKDATATIPKCGVVETWTFRDGDPKHPAVVYYYPKERCNETSRRTWYS